VGPAKWSVHRLGEDIDVLGRRALDRAEYYREVGARLRRVVDCDALCWHTLDPQTRLMTSDAPDELIEQGVFTPETAPRAGELLVASEYLIPDVNTFAGLARKRVPVGILSDATNGQPERSPRYNGLLAPAGIPFELRAAFVTRGRAWGAVHAARREAAGDFTRDDAAALAHIAAAVANGIRTSVRFDAARRPAEAGAPGLVVLTATNQVEMITPPARELMAALRSSAMPESDETPPTPLIALASFARAADRPPDPVAVPGRSGWVTLHASLPEGRADGRVAIVLERTVSAQAAALRLEAYGVTAREREVAVLLAQGLSNPDIATTLVLSPYTVQDHVKSLFDKTGVASRQELVARVFLDDYLPHLAGRTPLTSNGVFAD
jgi:DNA-binding CsgD family transcriptional regulator